MKRAYINLSSGITRIEEIQNDSRYQKGFLDGLSPVGLVRIQSTWCEQKRWDKILQDLDYGFLLDLALGHDVVVYDASAQKDVSRALYQGLEWIRYVLTRRWLGKIEPTFVKRNDVTQYFGEQYLDKVSQNRELKRKLDYPLRLAANKPEKILLEGDCKRTDLDGKYSELSVILNDRWY